MATSLADQLRKLAIPQTNLLTDAKKRASLLFDPSEAAKLSRDALFDIGLSGLKELIEINPYFGDFQDSLFNFDARNLQRVVESKDVNKKLDKSISKFLFRLSPYLLLKPSHKALEWLIYRYRIHEVNTNDLFALILPYHESNIFVKILQLIDLDASTFREWSWLQTLQKKGLHLPKQVLINHAISDSSFLRFICDTTIKAVKVHSKTKSETKLRTFLAFYASSVVGVLAREQTSDHILTVLMPSLLAGLSSPVIDFKAAAYMAVAQLSANNQLAPKLLGHILGLIAKDEATVLRKQRILLLLTIYQRQQSPPPLPVFLLKDFRWAIPILAGLARSGVLVGPLVQSIAYACVKRVMKNQPDRVEAQILCWDLMEQVQCDDANELLLLRGLDSLCELLPRNPSEKMDAACINDVENWFRLLMETAIQKRADIFDRAPNDADLQRFRKQWVWQEKNDNRLDPAVMRLAKKCAESGHANVWPQLKPLLLKEIDKPFVFKTWCKASPPDEILTVLLCIDQFVKPSKNDNTARLLLTKIEETNFGKQSRLIQHLFDELTDNKGIEMDKAVEATIQEVLVSNPESRPNVKSWVSAVQELRKCEKIFPRSKVWSISLRVMIQLLPAEADGALIQDVLTLLDYTKTLSAKHQLEVISALTEHIKSMKIDDSKWYDISSEDVVTILHIKTLELSLCGLHATSKMTKDFVDSLSSFFKNCFADAEAGVRFLSSICSGAPSTADGFSPVPYLLQIYALHWAWAQLRNSEALFRVFKAEGIQLTCHLLISLSSSSQSVRIAARKVLEFIVAKVKDKKEAIIPFQTLLLQLESRCDEIEADADQLNVALYCLLSPNESVVDSLDESLAPSLARERNQLISLLTLDEMPLYIASKISVLLESVNSSAIIKDLCPLAKRALESPDLLVGNTVLSSYWQRLNDSTVEVLKDKNVWELLKRSLAVDKNDRLCPAIAFLKAVSKEVFAALSAEQQGALLELLVATRADTENTIVSSTVAAVCRKIALDGKVVLRLLKNMVSALPKRGINDAQTTVLEARYWRHGVTLLELIQNKKKLRNSKVLIAPLFAVLKFCLDQEEQMAFEYPKQLVLGVLLDICERVLASEGTIEEVLLDVELIVECLRASSNPQTHHHALLLLSCLGSIIPNHVMHNIMTIFTFMGSSVARLDDEHSVQVVARVVDTIVPVLVKSFNKDGYEQDIVLAEVLRIFVWTLHDIPQHRRNPLFNRLLATLNPQCSLWIFLLLIFENYVTSNYKADKTSEGSMPPSLHLGMELSLSFGPEAALTTISKLIKYLVEIPINKMNPVPEGEAMDDDLPPSNGFFDIKKHSPKQLRHYVYTLITFLTGLLSDSNLILQVRELEKANGEIVENVFQDAMGKLLLATPTWHTQHEIHQNKFWKAMLGLGYDVLDRLVALVSSDTLVGVITQLMGNSSEALRRKALDLLNVHIQNHRGSFTAEEKTSLMQLIQPLRAIACSKNKAGAEGELIQQNALLSLRLLVRVLGSEENQPIFKTLLVDVCKLFKGKGHLMASAALTAADLVGVLSTAAFPLIPNFLPPILEVFTSYVTAKSPDIVVMSIAAALYRVLEVLPQFVSPYMDSLLYSVSCLSIKWPDAADLCKKLLQIRQKLASAVPHRVLIPSVTRTYEKLVADGKLSSVGPLLFIVAESLNSAQDVSKLLPDLTPLFIKVLQLRSEAVEGALSVSDEDVEMVEGFALDALLPLVLKLSELSFKPLYYQLFHWASEHPHRAITFYRLSSRLAEGLKGLFVLFAGHFLQNAATLLDATNVTKAKKPYYGSDKAGEAKAIMLMENIIKTLHTVFLFDSSTFLNKDKFQILLHPLVDQLDNTLGGPEALDERTKRLLTPCISQMALATDDTQWKALNYQILMKTTSTSPLVRIGALNTVVEVAAKLGEDYLALLPETIGSLAELLEDEDERVEMAMKEALRRMEDVLGQPIRDYFQ